jgi:hypothetical protein
MMTVQTTSQHSQFNFLRRTLLANSLFSAVSGVVLTFDAQPIASFLGLDIPWILVGIGISLLFYAVGLFQTAVREPLNRLLAITAIVLDTAWVVGSAVILFTNWLPLTTPGWWAVAIMADLVAVFAALQFYGLRRETK